MNVLHVFKDAFPPTYGGVEQHIWELTQSLRPAFEFGILTASRSRHRTEEHVEGVRFVRVPEYGRVASTPVTPSWWRELRQWRGTAHFHLPLPVAELVSLSDRHAGPRVASYYADLVSYPRLARGYSVLQQRFLERADRIIVSSQMLARSPALARHHDRVVVIPFGVDADQWPTDPQSVARIRGDRPGPMVLFLGRLVPYKGVDVLIEAVRSVDASLVVAGDGPERQRLQRLAEQDGRRGRIEFVGHVSNAERSAYYRAADLFVLPSVTRAETFGIAMLEAMAMGTPVISTELGTATSWVNRHGETGLVVPPRDPATLAGAITTLLSDDPLRRRMGEAAAGRARKTFAKQAMLDAFTGVYRSALGRDVGDSTSR